MLEWHVPPLELFSALVSTTSATAAAAAAPAAAA